MIERRTIVPIVPDGFMRELQIQLNSLAETRLFAQTLAAAVELPMLVALSGTLGAGKTQLVRFVAQALGVATEEVTSPTYVLLQRYSGRHLIHHFDFYRLRSAAEVWDLGIDELLEQSALIFVEWAEKFPECLPDDRLNIRLEPVESATEQCRQVSLAATGPRAAVLLSRLLDHRNACHGSTTNSEKPNDPQDKPAGLTHITD